MDYIHPCSDTRHDAWCIHCGKAKDESTAFTRDHLPTKSLLDQSLPKNLPTLDICGQCNNSLSQDEEYLRLILTCVLEGTCEPDELQDQKAARALRRNGQLLEQLRSAKTEYQTLGGQQQVVWQPDESRLLPPLIKNARGHFKYELAERAEGDPSSAVAIPLISLEADARSAFEAVSIGNGWPEVGSRMMNRMITGIGLSDGWIVVQPGVYRYAIHEYSAVRIVIREYLAFEAVWN